MAEKGGFTQRLHKIFSNASMAEIARQLDLPHATIRNYFAGRLPSPEVLIRIAEKTNVSLNWLLTGQGEVYAGAPKVATLDALLEDKIAEIVEKRLLSFELRNAKTPEKNSFQNFFDIEVALEKSGDPHKVMKEWFSFEGRSYPRDYGVIFFQGWDSFTQEEKIEAIKDAKKVLDRVLAKSDLKKPRNTKTKV